MGANTSKANDPENHSSHSSTHHKVKDLVDFGPVLPNGLYPTALQDYDLRCVRNLILSRKLAPFYKGLPEPPEVVVPTFTRPTLLEPPVPAASSSMSTVSSSTRRAESNGGRPRSASSSSCNSSKKQQQQQCHHTAATKPVSERQLRLERMRLQREMLYNNAIECPICFLYYPANINYSRCCDQPLCTECFVQIKRPTETPNTPATCPFCMQENFGIIYHPPAWSEKSRNGNNEPTTLVQEGTRHTTSGVAAAESRPRRATLSHRDPSVVLVDHVRPNWHRTQATTSTTSSNSRRSSTLLRTVPTGYNHQHGPRSNRSASSATASEYNHFLSTMRGMDMDLEEWMVMEAIRRSLAEQENMTSVAQDADDNEPLYATARRLGYQQQQQQQQVTGSTESSSTSDASSDENDPTVYIDRHAESGRDDKRVAVDPSNTSGSNGNGSNGNSNSGSNAGVVC
ncbi:hypothetical protein O0I10_004505 [Lichtheimia ornata]|uniref:RING-type domain-containing protein n=1 Tax=Lichtheimia ornata TaxID=688661 RepID=A0AAD7V8K4_9FUNG|nr:uncharacterized protein O0I10_004505 [Lichtheimia ornata]KAJ8659912.1 hypothetical protein O0I10_004505 [Lichtheimia ornata]